jgi:large subunit ribosomal protein L32e
MKAECLPSHHFLTKNVVYQVSWRKPRGVDCATRRKFKGTVRMPVVGSKQDHITRHLLPCGFRKMLIRCEADLELLLMNNRTYCAEIAQNIAASKR